MTHTQYHPKARRPSDPPAGFNRQEWSVIRACFEAHKYVENGHYLTSGRYQTKGAESLLARGLINKAPSQPMPNFADAIVVFLTQENWDDIRAFSASSYTEIGAA